MRRSSVRRRPGCRDGIRSFWLNEAKLAFPIAVRVSRLLFDPSPETLLEDWPKDVVCWEIVSVDGGSNASVIRRRFRGESSVPKQEGEPNPAAGRDSRCLRCNNGVDEQSTLNKRRLLAASVVASMLASLFSVGQRVGSEATEGKELVGCCGLHSDCVTGTAGSTAGADALAEGFDATSLRLSRLRLWEEACLRSMVSVTTGKLRTAKRS